MIKTGLSALLDTKMIKKSTNYVQDMLNVLMKPIVCLFLLKMDNCWRCIRYEKGLSNLMKKEFDREPVYNEKYLKT